MYNQKYLSSDDLNEWWEDLTIEQRRAAWVAWCKSDIQSVHIGDEKDVKSMTHEELQAWLRQQSMRGPSQRYG